MPGSFDRFMVQVGIGPNRKMRRLTVDERWAFVAGILPLAAEATPRGHLLISEGVSVTAADIADQAGVTEAVAESALVKLRELGTIASDSRGEYLASWSRLNPAPRPSDTREAWAERKRLERSRKKATVEQERQKTQPQLGRRGTSLRKVPDTSKRKAAASCPGAMADPRWVVGAPKLFERIDGAEVFLSEAHVHRVDGAVTVLGVPPETVDWVNDRFGTAMSTVLGFEIRAEACAGEQRERGAA